MLQMIFRDVGSVSKSCHPLDQMLRLSSLSRSLPLIETWRKMVRLEGVRNVVL